jgi:uncharacterized protein YndB with AHSA1/START domain
MSTDRIEKRILLRAPLERVWNAVSDAKQFGRWFGAAFDGTFEAGSRLTGKIVPTAVDAEVAKLQEPHRGKPFELTVERIEPPHRITFRWHPFAIAPGVDYSQEPMTSIVFELKETPEGVQLTITESGFDRIPLARRAEAFKANEGGWEHQTRLIKKYLEPETKA